MKKIWSLLKKIGVGVIWLVGGILVVVVSVVCYPISYVLMILFRIPYVVFKGINTVTGTFWHSLGVAFKEAAVDRRKKSQTKPVITTIAGTEHVH